MKEQVGSKQTLTEKEFCAAVGLGRTTVWKLRTKRELPHCRVGSRIIYLPEHVTQFLKAREAASHFRSDGSSHIGVTHLTQNLVSK